MSNTNQVVCPACGEVRMETPPGTTALPTLGMARKLAGEGPCDCGAASHERAVGTHASGQQEPGTVAAPGAQD
jgi:hypothetical protein